MNEPNTQHEDEVGDAIGPQGAAKEALEVEVEGFERASDGAAPPPSSGPSSNTWAQTLRPCLNLAFGLAGSRWPKMAAEPAEIDAMVEVLSPVMEKHCGGVIPIEYVAAGTCAAIVLPKVLATWLDSKREQAAREAGQSPDGAAGN